MHAGAFAGTGARLGDTVFNYRYQVMGSGDSRFAFAPRMSVLFPTGDVTAGRGLGAAGVQANLPVSIVLHRRLVTHWNAGSTFVPHAQGADHLRASSVGYTLSQSFIFLAQSATELPAGNCRPLISNPSWARAGPNGRRLRYMSPGVRWAFNFKSGLQIVPGVAMPIGIGPSAGEKGLFLYLSFEHPFGRA